MAEIQAVRLFGREREELLIRELLDNVQSRGGELLLRGEAGVGKSSLLKTSAVYAQQRGFRVLRSAGIQSEANLPFAGLHQLLRPVQGGIDALPEPQRGALMAAFGMSNESPPDLFLIALATLNLLAELAAAAPLLVVADDIQFIDRPTSDVLVFVARRLESDPIVLLSAIRDGYETALAQARLRELRLEALDDAAAAALLEARAPGIPSAKRQWLLAQSAGNPLALTELPLDAPSMSRGGPVALPPLTGRLEEAFTSRITELPETARSLLLVAAANDSGNIDEILKATSVVSPGVALDDLVAAVSVRLVELEGGEVRFRHPLARSGVYRASAPADRRAAHAALAGAIRNEPDRVAWHLAAATLGTNGRVAALLEAASQRALQRGALTVAVEAITRAADLADDPAARNRNLVRAARLAAEVEPRVEVLRLLDRVDSAELDVSSRGEREYVRERVGAVPYSDADRPQVVAETALRALHDDNPELALDLLALAGDRCYFSNAAAETRRFVCGVASQMQGVQDDPRVAAALVFADVLGSGTAVKDVVTSAVLGRRSPVVELYLCRAAVFYGGCVEASGMLPSVISRLRSDGRLLSLTSALMYQSWVGIHLMDLVTARASADEGLRLASDFPTYYVPLRYGELTGDALRGNHAAAAQFMAEMSTEPDRPGNPVASLAKLAMGVVLLSQLRFSEAYDQLARLYDPSEHQHGDRLVTRALAVAYFADAAHHSDRRREAEEMLRDTAALARQLPAPLLHQHLDVAQALLSDDDAAEASFLQVMAANGPSVFLRANAELGYGAWLRRRKRIVEAREFLRSAREAFDRLGTVPWEERARRELAASGETSVRRRVSVMDRLTPQETQIAQLVATGLSNREIAQQLFLSHRTVGSHLYRIFPKLDITSRGQLADALKRLGAEGPGPSSIMT